MTDLQLVGIVNVNPDSFSTGSADDPLATALQLVADGAAVIDLGAQSASPSTPVVPAEQEVDALVPVVARLADRGVVVSVDTYKPEVARAVLDAGARIVNDYSGSADPGMLEVLARYETAQLVLTHNLGAVKQRLTDPDLYEDVVTEVGDWFGTRLRELAAAGIDPARVVLDPGIDLSKTPAQTLAIIRGLPTLRERFVNPFFVAISRKDFIGTIHHVAPHLRDPGTLATLTALVDVPRTMARVHAVAQAAQFLDVLAHLRAERQLAPDAELPRELYRSAPA